ncbi:hypothetical protein M0811_04633 [Anaeramoeba ignava]|uniref:UDENN FLCN/SMCR8-type domain-containing protein n=1 Tax=Anaeramoeba ignava TaxID=1746090 RepID=A0A9Q0LUF8_ANAIG|nr:hypothetical protein M0811_04633 [Anaeramoeba ignava]
MQNQIQQEIQTDIILVCEFCQQKGPDVLFTFPNQKNSLNEIALQIMATNYQSSKVGKPSPDTQFVIKINTNTEIPIYSYVHHFTLFDVEARGCVRPLCFSYLSHSYDKIMKNFTRFMKYFSKATTILKLDNLHIFLQRLDLRHKDLIYTNEQRQINPNIISVIFSALVPEYLADIEHIRKNVMKSISEELADILMKILKISNPKISQIDSFSSNKNITK